MKRNYLNADSFIFGNALAQFVMAERGLNTADKKLVKTVAKRVGSALRHHRAKGTLRSIKGPDSFLLWEITP